MKNETESEGKCKICFRFLTPSECHSLSNTLEFFETILIKLDLNNSTSYSICTDCEEKISSAFNFKCLSISTEDSVVPYFDPSRQIDLKKVMCKESYRNGTHVELLEVCRLCKKFVTCNSVVPLKQILEDGSMVQIFENHIPEINLDATLNPFVCQSCQGYLINFANLLFLLRDQNFIKFEKSRVLGSENSVAREEDFKENKTKEIKTENDLYESSEREIKEESKVEIVEMDDLEFKPEKMDCTVNRDDNTSTAVSISPGDQPKLFGDQNVATERKLIQTKQPGIQNDEVQTAREPKPIETQPEVQNDEIQTASEPKLMQTDQPEIQQDEVQTATEPKLIQTEHPGIQHDEVQIVTEPKLIQSQPKIQTASEPKLMQTDQPEIQHDEVQTATEPKLVQPRFRCSKCSVEFLSLQELADHYPTHKQEVFRKCLLCGFATTNLSQFQEHISNHDKFSVLKKTRCPECDFETSNGRLFWTHLISHPQYYFKRIMDNEGTGSKKKTVIIEKLAPNLRRLFQCESCKFRTKDRQSFMQHMMIHIGPKKKGTTKASISGALKETKLSAAEAQSAQTRIVSVEYRRTKQNTEFQMPNGSGIEEAIHFCELCDYRTLSLEDLKSHVDVHV